MATHFKELATAVAKGMNFEENSIILATDEERHILNTKIKNIYEEILEGRSNHE